MLSGCYTLPLSLILQAGVVLVCGRRQLRMELIRGLHNLRPRHRDTVLTIGNFDGVHLGHQQILQRVSQMASQRDLRSTVMLFEPQPREWFDPDNAPTRLMSLRDKAVSLKARGVDQLLCVRFDQEFRSLSASQFVDDLLVTGLGVDFLVVGDDFRFGRGRDGDFAFLKSAGQQQGFTVEATPTCELDGSRVSSTRVRQALATGELDQATRLLGRPFHISGRVRQGDRIGRTLDVPTANLSLARRHAPVKGVYAVRVHGVTDGPYNAVANVGSRPTVQGKESRLEVHLLDYHGNLYQQHMRVDFLHFIRPEKTFDGLPELRAAIHQDMDQARAWFATAEGSAS